jgi:hypothetical protein
VIEIRPISLGDANRVVSEWHSHHDPVVGHKFSVSAYVDDRLEGVVIVSRPVAPALQQDGRTLEVTRLCCRGREDGGAKDVASALLARSWDATCAQGYRLLISYTRKDEKGSCYKAAGWAPVHETKGREWTSGNKAGRWLPGFYEPSTEIVDRVRWERRPVEHVRAVLNMIRALGRWWESASARARRAS